MSSVISLQLAGIPTLLEPAGQDRGDGNRPEGITLFPYVRGKSPVLDATCIDTFSPSNMIRCEIQARAAANEAESMKRSKYASLTDRFDFQLIVVEKSGVFGESTIVFLRNLESSIASAKGDGREQTWLMQRISLAVVEHIGDVVRMSVSGYRG